MFCCISNRVPHEPVVSKLSGCLYERSLIEQYIAEYGKCPITGEPLQKDDLISVRPAPLDLAAVRGDIAPGSETIPGILSKLHSHWDAIMLEQFSLRQQLAQTQQELAQALHQYEAACRVIATFLKDREDADVRGEARISQGDGSNDGVVLPEAALKALSEYDAQQRIKRKNRVTPPTLASEQNVRDFVEDCSIDVGTGAWAITFAADNNVYIGLDNASILGYDMANGSASVVGLGHERAVRHVVHCGNTTRIVSASDDATLRVWSREGDALVCQGVVRQHTGGIVGLGSLLAGHLMLSASAVSVGLADLDYMGTVATRTAAAEGLSEFTCLCVHPYGSLAVLGVKGEGLCIWNTRQMCVDTTVPLVGEGDVRSLALNSDCFTLATGLSNGNSLLWDLRKMSGPIQSILSVAAGSSAGTLPAARNGASVVAFDNYGKYLALAGSNIQLFDWATSVKRSIITLSSHQHAITGICWGADARGLASCSIDGTVRLYGSG